MSIFSSEQPALGPELESIFLSRLCYVYLFIHFYAFEIGSDCVALASLELTL